MGRKVRMKPERLPEKLFRFETALDYRRLRCSDGWVSKT